MDTVRAFPRINLLFALFVICVLIASFSFQKTEAVGVNGGIVYSSDADGDQDIYVMDEDGTNATKLTNNNVFDDSAAVSLDATKIVFYSERDVPSGEIYSMNIDGTNVVRLTNNSITEFEPVWSPDGTKIAFKYATGFVETEIYTMNADGTNQVNVTNTSGSDFIPNWSPDGTKIAFATSRNGNEEIYVMNADGSNQTRLTNNSSSDLYPDWSPDGTKIAFQTNRDGVLNYEIYVMNADGTNPTNITNVSGNNYEPNWSPDGTKIAYATFQSGSYDIFTMNADGTNKTNISDASGNYEYYPFWYGPLPPVVTPPVPTGDNDGDGISDSTEDAGPNNGDANIDTIADSDQPNVTTLPSPVTNDYTSVESTCSLNNSVGFIEEPKDFPDTTYNYPGGLIDFTLTCVPGSTADITFYYYADFSNTIIPRKYDSVKHTYQTITGATLDRTTLAGRSAAVLRYQITDGGELDQDGAVNGTIIDPVGPGTVTLGVPNTGFAPRR